MIRPVLLFSLLCEFVSVSEAQPVEIEPATGFKLEKILDYQDIHAFTWDEHGVLWLLSGAGHRLVVGTILGSKPGTIQSVRSIERRGNERAGLLVHANTIFVSDGDAIRTFSTDLGKSGRFDTL